MANLKKNAGGNLLKNASGDLVKRCDPCNSCTGAQPDIVVTGTGTGDCDVAGTYSWSAFGEDANTCSFQWNVGAGEFLLAYCKAAQTYCAWFNPGGGERYGGDADTCNVVCAGAFVLGAATDVGNPLRCIGGKLTGNFSLQGDDLSGIGGTDCSSFTISISFNGG